MSGTLLSLFLGLSVFQSSSDSIRRHYEAAEAHRKANNLKEARSEFQAILAEAYDKLGKIYIARKSYKEGIAALEQAARYAPDSVEASLELSIAYFDGGQYQAAIKPLQQALVRAPRNAGVRQMLGKTWFMLGDFPKAVDELKTALDLTPNDFEVEYTLGLAYLKQREFTPAKKIYDRMLAQLGDRPQLRIVFGRAYRETGFLPEAIEEFKRAVALDAHFPRVHYYLGLTYLLKDGAARLDDAAAEFRIELASHPDEFFANYYLGIVYTIQRRWADAVGLLEKAASIQPGNPDPYFHLGETYQALGRYDRAVEVLKKSIDLNPSLDHNDYQVTTAHYRLGQSLMKVGRTQEGEAELQMAAELKSKGFKNDELKTAAYLGSAGSAEPNGKLTDAVTAEGVVAESRALDEKASNELRDAESYYVKVIASAHNNVGQLDASLQDFKSAADQFAMAAKWNPQLEAVNFNSGLAYYKAELFTKAIPRFEEELKSNPGNLPAKQLLGLSYFMADEYSHASEVLADVVFLGKTKDSALYYALAISLIKQGKRNEADRVIREMVAGGQNSPQLHILMGQAYYEQGDTTKSLEELKAATAVDDKVRLAHYYTGLVYLRLGRFDDAGREFERELVLNDKDV